MTTINAVPVSLYVGDLHPEVGDTQLFNAFSEFQSLASVRVCRDSTNGLSLCYGYVNFLSPQDANQAIELKNHSVLNGKVIRVTWSSRDPTARKTGIGNVFIKNLNESVDNAKLQELFQKFGNIVSCKVVMSEDTKSKGFGFVQFEHEESAHAAIEKLNESIFEGKQLYVGKFVRKSDRASSGLDDKYTNLYVKNLDLEVNEELLKEKFSEFGKIASLIISKDENDKSRGFGFVNFDSPDDARRAMETMNGSQLAGSKVLYVARAQKKSEREQLLRRQFEERRKEKILKYQASNVYVKNIHDKVSDTELREQFSQCGTITSAKLMRDEKGISKGFGFVCFSTPEEANKAVTSFHGFMLHGKPLYVAIAQRKEERQAQLQLQFAQRVAGLAGQPAVFSGGYPPYYYTAPGIIPQVSPRPGLMYQPLAMGPGWSANGFAAPSRPAFQPSHRPTMPNNSRQHRQNRGRVNGHLHPQGGPRSVSFVPHLQQTPQLLVSSNDASNQQGSGHASYVPNGRARGVNKGTTASSVPMNSDGTEGLEMPVPMNPDGTEGLEMLSSRLAAASPDQQKQMLGDRLFPLVNQLKPDLGGKITGMLLEMDNSELLLLLESPESLSAKVEKAVEVLQLSKTKVADQEALHPSYLSAQVAVN
ncbi:polyadenylate-binding protein 7 isoform X1 [Daucus carota subsp. sativus]|uniref:polyadenylate-binding protein 7 isoform X1 n=1 Tax=Daucus carota subsp. sativus TaxID=79200 RepID=UPI0007EFEC75|nr:PREDICTED: polyadenylate-binding protein 7 isoform X3 [Daucus carota subsp. sativus]